VTRQIELLDSHCRQLSGDLIQAQRIDDPQKQALLFSDSIVDKLMEARLPADRLEEQVEDRLWPLPKYSEMLFIM
jgi:glutamine synthetase